MIPTFQESREEIQEVLRDVGFYKGKIDGNIGDKSKAAFEALAVAMDEIETETITSEHVDERSEHNISTLNPKVQPLARLLVHKSKEAGITVVVTSGSRTYDEQNMLYQAHLKGGPQAARPGYSNHNFGLAFDVTIFDGKNPIWESPNYKKIGAIGIAVGLAWGGDWTGKTQDEPHFELRPEWAKNMSEGAMIATLRSRKDQGKDLLA